MYTELKPELIIETLQRLTRRVATNFPESSLARVAGELERTGGEVRLLVARLQRPIWWLRVAGWLAIVALVALPVALAWHVLRLSFEQEGAAEIVQACEAAANGLVLLGVALYFLASLEPRRKQKAALQSLHQLRSIIHIVDMHQLTKDPEPILWPSAAEPTTEPTQTRFELTRYLHYSSEMLSLASKLAALHVQYTSDPVVLEAASDIENLAGQLGQKIGQKILILDTSVPPPSISATSTPATP